MSFVMINKLSLIAEIIAIIIFLHGLYGEKFRIDYKEVLVVAIDIIIMQSIDSCYLPRWMNVSMYLVIIIYCFFRFDRNVKKLVVNNALYIIFLGVLQVICVFIIYCLLDQGVAEEYKTLGTNTIVLVLCCYLSKRNKLEKISYYFQRDDIIIRVILIAGVGGLLSCIYLGKASKGIAFKEYLIPAITVLVIFIMTISWQAYKIKAKEREMELKAYKLYEESYSNLISEIRLKQHEFNNHINALYSQHLVCKTYEELVSRQREYCENILYDNRYEKLLRTGNSMLIGFLYGKFVEAEKIGISVEYDIKCLELQTKLPMYKLVELVGNLFNNAMDALKDREDKRLYFSIKEEVGVLNIEVRNVYEILSMEQITKMFHKGYSSKGENRGLGLYNVKKMSKEYNFEVLCRNLTVDSQNWISFSVKLEKSV